LDLLPPEVLGKILDYAIWGNTQRVGLFCVCKSFEEVILAHVSFDSGMGLEWAVRNRNKRCFVRLLRQDWVPSSTLLEDVVLAGDHEWVGHLLEQKGADFCKVVLENRQNANAALSHPCVDPNVVIDFLESMGIDDVCIEVMNALVGHSKSDPTRCLRMACLHSFWQVAEALIDDPRTDHGAAGNEALRMAVRSGNVDIMRRLLSFPSVSENITSKVLSFAAGGTIEALELVLSCFSQTGIIEGKVLVRAANHSFQSEGALVKLLLADSRLADGPHMSAAFLEACNACDLRTVEAFLQDRRVDPTVNDSEAFGRVIRAARNLNISVCPVVDVFLQDGRVDPSGLDNWAVCEAAFNGFADGVKMLFADSRVDPMARDNLPLYEACTRGHVDVVRALLSDPRMDIGNRAEQIRRQVSSTMKDADTKKNAFCMYSSYGQPSPLC
jgi:hypothetical protein